MKFAAITSLLLASPLFAQTSHPGGPLKKLEIPEASLYVNGDALFIKNQGCLKDPVKAPVTGMPSLFHSAAKVKELEGRRLCRGVLEAKTFTADEKQFTMPRLRMVPFAGLDDAVPNIVRFQEVWEDHGPHSHDYLTMLVLSPAAAPAVETHQPQAALGRESESKADQDTPALGSNAPRVMVFIDPATGKMVQPTEAQIGQLAPPLDVGSQAKAPVITIQGPGGAVGIVLTPGSFSYSIATRNADGKIALNCVTGDQAAERMVSKESSNRQPVPQAKGPFDEKH